MLIIFIKDIEELLETILLHKILGAFAKEGGSIDEIEQLALSLSPEIYTLGVLP